MSSINEKLGIKRAGPRTSVFGRLSGATCPRCPHRHVIEHCVRGEWTRACGACGHVWPTPSDQIPTEAA